MNFGQAISSGFSNYVNFSTRAARSEYWFWTLFAVLATGVTLIIDNATGVPVTYPLFGLAVFLPGLGVSVRRLHDTDRSGWWLLLILIPLVGTIVLLIWFCTQGTSGPNRFGPDPLGAGGLLSQHPAA
jgi:uncharacterized membrane protein YhaH (DUF805 family)